LLTRGRPTAAAREGDGALPPFEAGRRFHFDHCGAEELNGADSA